MSGDAQDEDDMHANDDQHGDVQHGDALQADADGLGAERVLDCDGHQIPGSGCEPLAGTGLLAHLDGELSAIASARVAEHLAACPTCAHEAALLGVAGDLVAALPRHTPGADFVGRVTDCVGNPDPDCDADDAAPRGRLLRLWPAAAAAAVLVVAIAARSMLDRGDTAGGVLTASEEREIASDLYVLTNLETLETVGADELIALVEQLDLLEGLEPEMSGLYAAADDGEGG